MLPEVFDQWRDVLLKTAAGFPAMAERLSWLICKSLRALRSYELKKKSYDAAVILKLIDVLNDFS